MPNEILFVKEEREGQTYVSIPPLGWMILCLEEPERSDWAIDAKNYVKDDQSAVEFIDIIVTVMKDFLKEVDTK